MNPDLGKFKLGKVIKMNKIMPLMVSWLLFSSNVFIII